MFGRFANSALRASIRIDNVAAVGRSIGMRQMSKAVQQGGQQYQRQEQSRKRIWQIGGMSMMAAGALAIAANPLLAANQPDYNAIRADIAKLIDADRSNGPLFIRLAWHASGTYDKHSKTGGSNGATMRFDPEAKHGANAGLGLARSLLEKIKQKYPEISYSDLWTLAGVVAVEELGGPKVKWRAGRSDKAEGSDCTPSGRLPNADEGHPKINAQHVRDIFHRMGFNDQEIVALVGAHAVGRCHPDRSGFSGPWTFDEFSFTNDYFVQLLSQNWTPKKWNGPQQFEDPSGKIMMLPADLVFIQDPQFRKYAEIYAKDQDRFFKDFAAAFQKLTELGMPAQSWFSYLFGY